MRHALWFFCRNSSSEEPESAWQLQFQYSWLDQEEIKQHRPWKIGHCPNRTTYFTTSPSNFQWPTCCKYLERLATENSILTSTWKPLNTRNDKDILFVWVSFQLRLRTWGFAEYSRLTICSWHLNGSPWRGNVPGRKCYLTGCFIRKAGNPANFIALPGVVWETGEAIRILWELCTVFLPPRHSEELMWGNKTI